MLAEVRVTLLVSITVAAGVRGSARRYNCTVF